MPRLAGTGSINEVIVLISEERIMLCCTANASYRQLDNTSDGAINCSTNKHRCWEEAKKNINKTRPATFHHYLQIRGGKTVLLPAKPLSLFLCLICQPHLMASHSRVKCACSSWGSSSLRCCLLLLVEQKLVADTCGMKWMWQGASALQELLLAWPELPAPWSTEGKGLLQPWLNKCSSAPAASFLLRT